MGTRTCSECVYYAGEECNGFTHEGTEVYDYSDACDDFVPIGGEDE
ncbi:hypothetical protein KAR91_26830 [Candidatus Pacearchaeota archaeon]|nr:hypothetical protein [Candidatus Pacearchaeota archaeon]